MTYGWAILVVLIAIGALAYFGVLNPNKFIADRCTISTGSGIFCQDYNSLSSPAGINLELRNGLGDAVNISNVSLTYQNGVNICVYSTYSPCSIAGPPTAGACFVGGIPAAGIPGTLVQPDSQASVVVSKGTTCTGLTSGTKIKGDLKITYTQGSSTLVKTTTGSLITTVQ